MSYEYLITCLIVVLLPGTGVIYTIAIGLAQGFRASVIAAFGCTLGIIPAAFACIVGLAALLHTSALAFVVLKYVGVAYLLYIAWSMLRNGGALEIPEQGMAQPARALIINAVLLNALNPKLSLFFLAFLPQFVPADSVAPTGQLMLLAAIFMTMTFAVFVLYGAGASLARDYVIARPRVMVWFRRGFAGAFGLLGLKLAVSDA